MDAFTSTGSPKMTRRTMQIARSINQGGKDTASNLKPSPSIIPLPNSLNRGQASGEESQKLSDPTSDDDNHSMTNILARLRMNDARNSGPHEKPQRPVSVNDQADLDKLINTSRGQHKKFRKQEGDWQEGTRPEAKDNTSTSSHAEHKTYPKTTAHILKRNDSDDEYVEMLRVKQELEAAKSLISRQQVELAESRNLKHTMEQAIGPLSEADFSFDTEVGDITGHHALNVSARPFTSRGGQSTLNAGDARDGFASTYTNSAFGRNRNAFGYVNQALNDNTSGSATNMVHASARDHHYPNIGYAALYGGQTSPVDTTFGHRTFSGSSNSLHSMEDRFLQNFRNISQAQGARRDSTQVRSTSTLSDPLSPNIAPYATALATDMGLTPLHTSVPFSAQSRPFGGDIPIVSDFSGATGHAFGLGPAGGSPTYITPLEPMNYRRLLDKSVSCDWKYIVDKIVCNNDQQASIFLQQKLKVGTAEQKFEIVESIVNQAYPLMINRFGNFLVQRCFEHGTPEQVVAIANAIRGNTLNLSMDAFGCHVVQKAFDAVPEEYKAIMVRELLHRIPETVIHRYACHVWQKLFELRWSDSPPQIMKYVNEALHGMWHEVALGETGSLVVQNIFENCLEEDKRPCIDEVLKSIDIVAHGQFGNWCIQHICEHGAPADRTRAVDHVLRYATEYSMDQFASKVVEKCLKISGAEFLGRYLDRVCEGRADRPRIPLIDIASDQYGNYLVQWILAHANAQHREVVASHIRKHMVSLRGSKFGSRVGLLCNNPAYATRPGPPVNIASASRFPGVNNEVTTALPARFETGQFN